MGQKLGKVDKLKGPLWINRGGLFLFCSFRLGFLIRSPPDDISVSKIKVHLRIVDAPEPFV